MKTVIQSNGSQFVFVQAQNRFQPKQLQKDISTKTTSRRENNAEKKTTMTINCGHGGKLVKNENEI